MLPNTQARYTRTPKWHYQLLPFLSDAENRILQVVENETIGWNRETARITIADFEQLTGMKRATVTKGITQLIARGVLQRTPDGHGMLYELVEPCEAGIAINNRPVNPNAPRKSSRVELFNSSEVELLEGHNSSRVELVTVQELNSLPIIERKIKERGAEHSANAPRAQTSEQPNGSDPTNQNQPDQPVRTPAPPISAAPPPPPQAEQPRLVDAPQVDPVKIYREATGVHKPNQAQRKAISAAVHDDLDLWQAECERFARNGYNVRNIDNLLDAWRKASAQRAQRRRAEAARAAEPPRERLLPPPDQRRKVTREEFLRAKAAYFGEGSPFHSRRSEQARAS